MPERIEPVQRAFTAYTIERELGAGGMATVYLAHDKKHDRKVAIKILHAELAAVLGADRFLQEIRVTANLQHPHILGLIDSGVIGDGSELKGRPYYVMPFVEGESLRQRLDKERQLPVSDSVRIASEVASALDYAHRHNVIHRDIKPENVLLHDGSAIVADFGIALAVTQAGGARMTQTGLSLGTPNYMSPEQAMGERTITARSDIYSLGAVTYEMLAGEPPFTGPTAQAVVARVMTEEPRPLTNQRRHVPPNVGAAVSRSLEKVPADRFASAHEFAEALNNPSFAVSAKPAAIGRNANGRERKMFYAVAAFAILMTVAALWGWMRPAAARRVLRYGLALDSAESMVEPVAMWGRLTLSPDGSRLAYVGGPRAQLLIRQLNELGATALPGTEGGMSPFFSPDGKQIGYLTYGRIHLASINGGQPITISDSLIGVAGATWSRDGFIYADANRFLPLLRVEAKSGAQPQWFTALDTASGESDHAWPDALPNGKGVIFSDVFRNKNRSSGKISFTIAVAEIPSGKHRVIVRDAMYARYVAGQLLYVTTSGTLMVVPFDQNSMKVSGEATAVVDGMRVGSLGATDLAASESGTLVYATGEGEGKQELVWVARDGKAQPVDPDWHAFSFGMPALSPDGKQLAVSRRMDAEAIDIWIKQLDRGPSIKLTTEGIENYHPAWTPDAQSVTFSSNASGSFELWSKRADGSTHTVLQLHEKRNLFSPRWSPDGKWLLFYTDAESTGAGDILAIRPGIDSVPVPLLATKFTEKSPALSPDGRWLAYVSNESGQDEIYVAPFPNTSAAKWVLSTRGGTDPQWSHSGRELFYLDGSRNLVAAGVETKPRFSRGRSTILFSAAGYASEEVSEYAVGPDDRRFLMIRPLAPARPDKVVVVENWLEELKAKQK